MIPLTVVIGTTRPWPEIEMTLESVWDQAQACGAEVIVTDSSGQALPPDASERYPELIWLTKPGVPVHVLRGMGLAHGRGEIIATTEDHVRVAPDWCAQILRAYAEHPEAGAIGGVVENAYGRTIPDWAHHFLVFGPLVPPVRHPVRQPPLAAANASYRRSVLPLPLPGNELMEMFLVPQLRASGVTILIEPKILVYHWQPVPFLRCCTYHFHNGRALAAGRLRLTRTGLLARLLSCPILPAYIVGHRIMDVWPKPEQRRRLVAGLPWLVAYSTSQAVGELATYLVGPGSSPLLLP